MAGHSLLQESDCLHYAALISDSSWEPSCCWPPKIVMEAVPTPVTMAHGTLCFFGSCPPPPTPILSGFSCALELNTHVPSLAEFNTLIVHHWTVTKSDKSSPGRSSRCEVCVPSERLLPTPNPEEWPKATGGGVCLAAQHL